MVEKEIIHEWLSKADEDFRVGLEEAELFKDEPMRKARRLMQLDQIRKVRERLYRKRVKSNSVYELGRLRKSRLGDLTGSH